MMCPVIDNPTSREIRAVIRFLHAAEIYHELCVVYDQNAMSEGTARQWSRMFKDGWVNKCSQPRAKWSVGHP
jgi:hypothetical protein